MKKNWSYVCRSTSVDYEYCKALYTKHIVLGGVVNDAHVSKICGMKLLDVKFDSIREREGIYYFFCRNASLTGCLLVSECGAVLIRTAKRTLISLFDSGLDLKIGSKRIKVNKYLMLSEKYR